MAESNIQDLINSIRTLTGATTEEQTDADYLDIVDTNGGLTLTTSYQDISFPFIRKIAPATYTVISNTEVEFNRDGTFIIISKCTTTIPSGGGTSRSDSSSRLMFNEAGSGYTYLQGSITHMYNRDDEEGTDTSTSAVILTVNTGDKIKMQVRQDGGTSTVQTVPGGSSLIIFNTIGQKGEPGEVTIKTEGVNVPNYPHNKINFKGTSVDVEDVGNGQVDVEFDFYDALNSLQVRKSSGITLTSSFTDVEFDITDIENNTTVLEHDDSNTERINIKTGGTYLIFYSSEVDNIGQGRILLNNTTVLSGSSKATGYSAGDINSKFNLSSIFIANLSINDYITFQSKTDAVETTTLDNIHLVVFKLDGVKGLPGQQGEKGETGLGMFAWGRTQANGVSIESENLSVSRTSTGTYSYIFTDTPDNANYVITGQHYGTTTDTNIFLSNISQAGFTVEVGEGDNGGTPDVRTDTEHSVIIIAPNQKETLLTESDIRKFTHQKSYNLITGSTYTLDPNNDEVLLVDTTTSDCTITIPNSSTISNNGKLWEYWIYKNSSDFNNVLIQLSGQTFPLGYSKHTLRYAEEVLHLGGSNLGGWSKISTSDITDIVKRDTNWAETNFSTATAIPFESNSYNDNDEILIWSGTTQIKCLVSTRVYVSYIIDIDSTGGSTWNLTSEIRKNGTIEETTQLVTGNYGGEDQSLSCPPTPIDMTTGQYLELYVDQNSLTGNITNAVMIVKTTI